MCVGEGMCRTCLCVDNLSLIFARPEHCERYTVAIFLATGLQIEQNDGLPQVMCENCINSLNSLLEFRNASHRAEQRLVQIGFHRKKNHHLKTGKEECRNSDHVQTETFKPYETANFKEPLMRLQDMRFEVEIKNENNIEEVAVDPKIESTNDTHLFEEFEQQYYDDFGHKLQDYGCEQNIVIKVPPHKASRKVATPSSSKEKRQKILSMVDGDFDRSGPIQCRMSKKTVKGWDSFRSHCKLHFGRDFVCEHCGKTFISMTQLRRHASARHGAERELACQHCPYRALDRKQLTLHERRKHTGERPYVCDACGATYFSRRCLIQHIESHLTERSVPCAQCGSLFKSRRHLARHTYAVHASAARYRCRVCLQHYSKLRYARKHMRRVHGLTTTQQGHVDKLPL